MSLCSIVQEGPLASSLDRREITPNAFRWTGERSLDTGATFRLQTSPAASRLLKKLLVRAAEPVESE